jgi:hypothetical protein
MCWRKLIVAVSPYHQAARALNAPAHEANKVERGLIGPMQVLQHHYADRIGRRDALEQTGEQLLACTIRLAPYRQRESGGHFVDGS